MKKDFDLDIIGEPKSYATASIIGTKPNYIPYVKISYTNEENGREHGLYIKDKDLERFAVNILKALKSKRLKPTP